MEVTIRLVKAEAISRLDGGIVLWYNQPQAGVVGVEDNWAVC
jgi:hypothetical protein